MAKAITLLAVFFLTLNLFSGMLMSTGIGGMLGMQTELGGDEKVDESVEQAEEFQTGAPAGGTLFAMYQVLAGALNTLAAPITAGPAMLRRAGVPSPITDMLIPITGFIYAVGIISFLRGFNL